MASTALSPLLLLSFFSIAVSVLAQVPANQTFKIVNEGEFGEYIIEYDANYRVIRTDNNLYNDFFNYPFRLCFYNTTPNAYILAIRAGLPRDEDLMRWVWDANRNNPVRENATLTFGTDGNLVLANPDGRIAWQTNTANKGVTGIAMLPNGNLVLHDKAGKYVWQSFDYPSDTLLIGQSVRLNGRNKLVSRTSDADGRDGPYSIVLERSGFNMYVNYGGQRLIYGGFPSGDQKFVAASFEAEPENDNATAYELTLAFAEAAAPSPPPPPKPIRHLLQSFPIGNAQGRILKKLNYNGTLSFLRLDSDGNLRAYTYYPNVSYLKWDETFAFFGKNFIRECALPSKCGSYGLCDKRMCVACPTPKGLLGWSESCAPPKPTPCKGGAAAKVDYYKIVGVEHFMSPYLDKAPKMKVSACRDKCSKDCKCAGFFYREESSRCFTTPLLGTLIKDVNTSHVGYIKYAV